MDLIRPGCMWRQKKSQDWALGHFIFKVWEDEEDLEKETKKRLLDSRQKVEWVHYPVGQVK